MLALVCGAAFVSSCSNDDNNQDGPTPTPEQYDLAFACSRRSSTVNIYLANIGENEDKLVELFTAKIDEVAGAKNGVVTVTPDTAGDVKEKVKQALIDYAAELEESHKYIGKYEFTFTCNTVDLVKVILDTADEFAFSTFQYKALKSNDGITSEPIENLQEIRSNYVSFSQLMLIDLTPFPGFEKEYKDALVKFSCVNAHGETIATHEDDVTSDLNFLKYNKQTNINTKNSFVVSGGEYTATFDNTFMNYKKNINFTVLEDAKAIIRSNDEGYEAVFTTGYPFNPSDFTKEFSVNVKVVKNVDGVDETVNSFDDKITLVTDTSRNKVAATKVLNICKINDIKAGEYKIIITSDWEPANVQFTFNLDF